MTARYSGATWLLLALVILAVTGLVHIVTVLALPIHASDDAFTRVAGIARVNVKTFLPSPGSGREPLPFLDPAMATAVCRYDLRDGPFHLSITPIERDFLALGFHSRRGRAFYGLTVQPADSTLLDIVLVTQTQKEASDSKRDDDTPPPRAVVVVAPEPEGFITMKVPFAPSGGSAAIEARFDAIRCASDAAGITRSPAD